MPIQAPQWTEYLSCPVCEKTFDLQAKRLPISLGCGHTICKMCLANLQRKMCPFDQGPIRLSLSQLPINTALILLIEPNTDLAPFRIQPDPGSTPSLSLVHYTTAATSTEKLAVFLRQNSRQQLSRPMQRKLVTLINCQLLEDEGRSRATRAARSLGERSVTELILLHQNPQQLSAHLWSAVRNRGCQFLGPAMQEEVLKLVLLALEDGSALSRKVLVMFVVQRLEGHFPQASKTSIGHVVQLLYRASCFKVTKRDGDSSLMQLKEEFRTYDSLRREHDAQIVQIATEAGLRIAPDQWSSLLYGDSLHKSHMQSIIDKLQTPQSFLQSVQELVIALQRTGDPGKLGDLRPHLDFLATLDPSPDGSCPDWETLTGSLNSVNQVVAGLLTFIEQHHHRRIPLSSTENASSGGSGAPGAASGGGHRPSNGDGGGGDCPGGAGDGVTFGAGNTRYKTSFCRDSLHGSCPRGEKCTFAHNQSEIDQYRRKRNSGFPYQNNISKQQQQGGGSSGNAPLIDSSMLQMSPHHGQSQLPPPLHTLQAPPPYHPHVGPTPIAKVCPIQHFVPSPPSAAQATTVPMYPAQPALPPPPSQEMYSTVPLTPSAVVMPQPSQEIYSTVPLTPNAVVMPQPSQEMYSTVPLTPNAVVMPQPSQEMYSTVPLTPNAVVMPPPQVPPPPAMLAVMPNQAVIAPTPQARVTEMMATEHYSNHEMFPVMQESQINAMQNQQMRQPVGMATKSLSALKSRKEEIIDSLSYIVGKKEAAIISSIANESSHANTPATVSVPGTKKNKVVRAAVAAAAAAVVSSGENGEAETGSAANGRGGPGSNYSIWTTKPITSLLSLSSTSVSIASSETSTASCSTAASAASSSDEGAVMDEEEEAMIKTSRALVDMILTCADDDLIPFSDTPQISRFGPISRRTMLQAASPSQSHAVMSDEPTATAVVRHSKQIARQVPTMAALYHRNGSRTTLQPVSVGVNGEISYIAVTEQRPQPDPVLQHIQHTSALNQIQAAQDNAAQDNAMPTELAEAPDTSFDGPVSRNNSQNLKPTPPDASSQALLAESERMKQELEELQKKISNLNVNRDNGTDNAVAETGIPSAKGARRSVAGGWPVEPIGGGHSGGDSMWQPNEREDLSNELHMIESTIRERENEITVNHMRMAAAAAADSGSNAFEGVVDYGLFGGVPGGNDRRSWGIMTTATSGLCPKTRGAYSPTMEA